MKYLLLLLALSGCTTLPVTAPVEVNTPSCAACPVCPVVKKPMVAGYYAGWTSTALPPAAIDFSALTQIQNFSAVPNVDGTLNLTQNHLSPTLLAAAKAAGVTTLLSIGSANTAVGFRGATSNMATFVANIVALSAGYDGVDIDWEPLEPTDYPTYTKLIIALRAALPGKILAVALGDYPDPLGKVQLMVSLPQVDQINLMTYDLMSGPWSGWVLYHDSALYSYGPAFIRSADSIVSRYLSAGIPANKISIGIAFFGYIWNGVSKPLDAWTTPLPTATAASYNQIISQFGTSYIWDDKAKAAYISNPKQFISFENAQSIAAKIQYVKEKGLRGLIIWELSGAPGLMGSFK